MRRRWMHPQPCFAALLFSLIALSMSMPLQAGSDNVRRLPVATYREKMRAGWLGQMFGVAYGYPTEFRFLGRIIPESALPAMYPGIINEAFNQDDLYVEMTFLKTLETYGLDASGAQAGIDFANSEYQLWYANLAARDNLRMGIAPPDSGHPNFSGYSDDIDYQIEADYAGLIAPGLPNNAIDLGNTFGHIMNYGDGVYAGQFISCLYAEAFFETDPRRLVETGLTCIPAESQYAEAIRDVLAWSAAYPDDWQTTWELVNEKYHLNPDYRLYHSNETAGDDFEFNIQAKLNGAYVVMGLLYGNSDPMQTTLVALRSGQDSDCNPSSALGILATMLGEVPDDMIAELSPTEKFSYTDYNFEQLLDVSEKLARASVLKAGGSIEVDESGAEVFVIPVQPPQPDPFVQSWDPEPVAGSLYSDEQMAQIEFTVEGLVYDVRRFAPGWHAADCQDTPLLGLKDELLGRPNILFTYPADRRTPCRLLTTLTLPDDHASQLRLVIGHYPTGDWVLVVRANDATLLEQVIGEESAVDNWLEIEVDLSAYQGQEVKLELLNQANGRSWEGGYWQTIEVIEKQ
jgi:hypothetical protein